jgi:glycosidase
MHKPILSFFLFFLYHQINAQIVKLQPEKPTFSEEVVLTFDASQGNSGLAGYEGDIYVHTGLITGESTGLGDWKHVVADWGQNMPKLKMNRIAPNQYELKFRIAELYGIPVTGGNVVAFAFVFRNHNGQKIGKESGDKDIFHFLREPLFKPQPEALRTSISKSPEWARYATVYEVNIRQYTKEGTFAAFEEHLPRLKDLGANILWFMPIQEIGVKDRKGSLGSYYSIKDYTSINPEFGTIDDFKKLVKKAHGMGFKVILDWVANHSSRDNVWLESHPTWYMYEEDGSPVAPYDWSDVAKLDYEKYYLRKAMTEAMLFWIKECDIDGFRCDVAGEVALDFWEDTRKALDEMKDVWMLAEDGSKLWLLNQAFNANYGWEAHHLMNEIAKGKQKASVLMQHLMHIDKSYPKGTYPMHFTTNHDENSWAGTVFERLGDGHTAFAALCFTSPGVPLIYSGQEAGLNKRLEFFEKDVISWTDKSLFPFYKSLTRLKAENPALWTGIDAGILEEIKNDKDDFVLSFARTIPLNKVLHLANLSEKDHSVGFSIGKHEGIYRDYFTGKEFRLTKRSTLDLKAWETLILIFEKPISDGERKYQGYIQNEDGFTVFTSDGEIEVTAWHNHSIEILHKELSENVFPGYALDASGKKKLPDVSLQIP